jgi:hypothetical protein
MSLEAGCIKFASVRQGAIMGHLHPGVRRELERATQTLEFSLRWR